MRIAVADVADAFGSVEHGRPLRSALFGTEDPVAAAEAVIWGGA